MTSWSNGPVSSVAHSGHAITVARATCAAGALATGMLFVIAALAGSHNWVAGDLTMTMTTAITSTPSNITSIQTDTTSYAMTGTLNYISMVGCKLSQFAVSGASPTPSPSAVPTPGASPSSSPSPSTTPSPRPQPACSSYITGFTGGYPINLWYQNMCGSKLQDGSNLCSALTALVNGIGFAQTLEVALILLCALGFISAVGVALRANNAMKDDDPAAKGVRTVGSWIPAWGVSFDSSLALLLLSGGSLLVGLVFIISWPSILATVLNSLVRHLQTLQLNPPSSSSSSTVYAYSYSINPAPAAGYYIVLAGVLCTSVAFAGSWLIHGTPAALGSCCTPPPSGAARTGGQAAVGVASPLHPSVATSAPAVVAVGGGAYLAMSSPPAAAAHAYAPEPTSSAQHV